MVDQLYVGRGTRKAGPFSASQLRGLAASGRLQLTDTIWKEGMEKAVPAGEVKNLFSAVPVPPPVEAASLPELSEVSVEIGPLIPLDLPAPAGEAPPKEAPRPKPESRKRRAIGLKGVILLSQDGVSVHYRKKCTKCGYEDACRSTLHIGHGVSRINFYCPKCRKNQDVQIQGVMQ